VLANAREVLARLERYELDVFAEEDAIAAQASLRTAEAHAAAAGANTADHAGVGENDQSVALDAAARRAGRRKAVAQASLFDLANQKVVDEIRAVDPENISAEEAQALLRKLRQQMM
jgi:hypothetical protein